MKHLALTLAIAACSLLSSPSRAGEESLRLKEGAGREVTQARCAVCHSLDYITMVAPVMNRTAWEKSVRKMIDVFGAPVAEQDVNSIVQYLGEQYSGVQSPPH